MRRNFLSVRVLVAVMAAIGLSCLFTEISHATDLIGGAQPEMLSPEEAREAFVMAEGYEVSLYASEVDFPLHSPAAMTFDARGRLWVTNVPTHPHALPDVEPHDSVIILEDTDRDGKADKSTTFYDKLYLPMGIALTDGGRTVYTVSEPNLMRLRDTDGDGVADEERIEMHGFGTEDNHHVISAFQWGPGGRLYFGQGLFLNTQVETPYGPVRAFEAAVFRLDPRDQRLEVFAEYGWSNVWGIIFDHWGQPLLADASPALNYYLPAYTAPGDYPREGKYDKARDSRDQQSFTPAGRRPSCGNELLLSEHFPEDVRGWYVTNQMKGWHGVRWYQLNEEGCGVESSQPKGEEELMTTSDITFRPVAMQLGPDGALYVLDYYNPIVGHTTYNFRDPRRIQTHGRVWRITCKDRPLVWQPEIAGQPVGVLLDLLKNPNYRTRYHARRELQERPAEEVLPSLKEWTAAQDPKDPDYLHHLTEALWMHQSFNDYDLDLLRKLLAADDHHARTAAVRVLRYWQAAMPDEDEVVALLESAVTDESQRVRLEGLIACGFHGKPETGLKTAARVLEQEMDHRFRYAAQQTFTYLVKRTDKVPEPVDLFLLPYLKDEQLLTKDLTAPVAKERLTRLSVPVAEHRAALDLLAGGAGKEPADWLLDALVTAQADDEASGSSRTQVLSRLLLTWDEPEELAAREGRLDALLNEATDPAVRSYAAAGLIRAGKYEAPVAAAKSPGQIASWLKAVTLLGRSRAPDALYARIPEWMANGQARAVRLAAIDAASCFPKEDADAVALLGHTVDETAATDLGLSFAALESMKRIPRDLWPPEYVGKGLTKVSISATPDLKFEPNEFTVKAGSAVELRFFNPDNMYHNLVITTSGSVEEIGNLSIAMAADPKGLEKNYVPDHPGVLHFTPQLCLGIARTHTLQFFAPEEPGEYPYICTFPGHWTVMRGVMHVE